MYNFRKCTIGVAPTRRDTFLNNCRDQIMERVRQLAKTYDVELVTIEGLARENLLIDNCDIEKIVRRFREKDVDAVFVPHANFGQEEAVAKLCKAMGKPVLLWGPRDPAPLGVVDQMQDRAYDVQCGLFATGKALLSYGIPFTYIENCWLDSPILERGFEDFVRSVCAAKAFRGARVGQLSVRPWQFLTVRCNENELLEKFGIEVTPIESSEIISAIGNTLQNRASDIRDTIVGWTQKADLSALGNDSLKKMAAAVLAIREIAEQNGCNVMAGECWKMLQQAYGISACFVWGALTDMGLPVTCETDVLGAIGSGVMFGATRGETAPFFADITVRHPTNDNAELLWHCGPFPLSLAKKGTSPSVIGGKGQWEIEGGDITVLRIGCDRGKYTMFSGEAMGIDGPKTNGNYIWVETKDWPKWERKLVTGPYIHHVTGAHGRYQKILFEALKYMGDITPDPAD